MRELNEYKAEIFRRSECKLKRQKRRARILASCIPLCLCAVLLGIVYLPGRALSTGSPPAGAQESIADSSIKDSDIPIGENPYCGATGNPAQPLFQAECIRTYEASDEPGSKIIRTYDELTDYCTQIKQSQDFVDHCSNYDEGFFDAYSLILIRLQENSGSIRHKVTSVTQTQDAVCVYIERRIPECFTCDMASWHIIISIEKSAAASDNVLLHYTDIKEVLS